MALGARQAACFNMDQAESNHGEERKDESVVDQCISKQIPTKTLINEQENIPSLAGIALSEEFVTTRSSSRNISAALKDSDHKQDQQPTQPNRVPELQEQSLLVAKRSRKAVHRPPMRTRIESTKTTGKSAAKSRPDEEPKKAIAPGGLTIPQAPVLRTGTRSNQKTRGNKESHARMRDPRCEPVEQRKPRMTRHLTVPESPNLQTSHRVHETAEKEPSREKTVPQRAREVDRSALTNPQTPKLRARNRHRDSNFPTLQQRELRSIERAKSSYQTLRQQTMRSFQKLAQPQRNDTHRREIKPPTDNYSPVLLTNKRAGLRQPLVESRDNERQNVTRRVFKALPLNRQILERAPAPAPRAGEVSYTKPKTPKLTTKSRVRQSERQQEQTLPEPLRRESLMWTGSTRPKSPNLSYHNAELRHKERLPSPEPTVIPFRARAMPDPSSHFELVRTSPQRTVPAPFRLSESTFRGEQTPEEKKPRNFRARPIMSECGALPSITPRPVTLPEPFRLLSEELHKLSVDDFESRMEQEERELAERRHFNARPLPDLSKTWQPDCIATSRASVTPMDVQLATDLRAVERLRWEEVRAQEEAEAEMEREQRLMEQAELETRELEDYRQSLVFKARPIGFRTSTLPVPK